MKFFAVFLAGFLLLAFPVEAETMLPPEGALIVGPSPVVTFQWDYHGSMHYLEVYSGSATVFSKPVGSGSCSLTLKPDLEYRWKLREYVNGGYQSPADFRKFTTSSRTEFSHNGAAGATGAQGGTGAEVKVMLQEQGGFIEVTIEPALGPKEAFLIQKSPVSPVTISSEGGPGGTGAAGAEGMYVSSVSGSSGGPGGKGGPGGDGGKVTVLSKGTDLSKYVKVSVKGGPGGSGGAGGSGGSAGYYETASDGTQVWRPGTKGADGPRGAEGEAGKEGKVVYEVAK
ncbi:MAG: hypothetical protein RDV48_07980 [Candidatus Eremiobacteraeota bacterium]|nr:hypothetical protein [Candidatus Eremiobacteraeota bacterium]